MISPFQAILLPQSKEKDTIIELYKRVNKLKELHKKRSLVADIYRAACRRQCPMCGGYNHKHSATCTLWPVIKELTSND